MLNSMTEYTKKNQNLKLVQQELSNVEKTVFQNEKSLMLETYYRDQVKNAHQKIVNENTSKYMVAATEVKTLK